MLDKATLDAEHDAPAEPAADTEEASPGADEPAGRRRLTFRLPSALTLALGAALALALAAAVTFGLLFADRVSRDNAEAEALSTARAYAVTLTTYDHRTIDETITDVLDGATGEFEAQYDAAKSALSQMVTESKVTAEGTVLEAGVKSANDEVVEVVLLIDQTVTEKGKDPQDDPMRMLLTLQRHDDRWLASDVVLR